MDRHSLIQEFPEHKDKIHQLKMEDNHFKKLFEKYHILEHEIHRIKSGTEVTSDEELNHKKIEFLQCKDELFTIIKG